jgi:hypothetical protein
MPSNMTDGLMDYFFGSSVQYSPISSPSSTVCSCESAANEPQITVDDLPTMPEVYDMIYSESVSPASTGDQPAVNTEYQPESTGETEPAPASASFQPGPATSSYQSAATTSHDSVACSSVEVITEESSIEPKKEVKMPQSKQLCV